MKKRDCYLDFYRGIAILSVMFIHTTFHSGVSYIPDTVRTLSLLLDVPFFMFLTGWSAWYSHTPVRIFKSIFDIWKKWLFFIIIINITLVIIRMPHLNSLNDWLSALLFIRYSVDVLPVVGGSNWYIPIYFTVLTVGILWINLSAKLQSASLNCLMLLFFMIGLCYLSFGESYQYTIGEGGGYFGLSKYFCFYIIIFWIGYVSKEYHVKSFFVYILLCTGAVGLWFLCSRTYGIAARDLQGAKFPPHLMYFFASFPSICTALFLKGRIDRIVKIKWIRSIGKDALFYYFAQGIGASALHGILPHLPIHIWYVKMVISFLINVSISVFIAKVFIFLYQKWQKGAKAVRVKRISIFEKYGM